MQVGVDTSALIPGSSGGLVPWLEGLLQAMLAEDPQLRLTLLDPKAQPPILRDTPRVAHRQQCDPGSSGIDVLFCCYPGPARFEFPTQRQVLFIPDMQHEHCPHFFTSFELQDRRRNFWRSMARCQAVVSLSKFSRESILQHPMARRKEVLLCPPGGGEAGVRAALHPPGRPYLFFPANLWPHKNHRLVLTAFQRFARRCPEARMVFTGETFGKWSELRQAFAALDVEHLGYVGRDELQRLMADCRGLIFFSQYEGFGLPLLEAFAAGVPVACSNTTALAEVAGNAALTCSPLDVPAMAAAMESLWSNPDLRVEKVAAGQRRLRHFSWSTSARRLLELCARLARYPGHRPSARQTPAAETPPQRRVAAFVKRVGPWGHRAASELLVIEHPLQGLFSEYLRQRKLTYPTPAVSLGFADWVQEHSAAHPFYVANPQYRRAAGSTTSTPAELLGQRPCLFLGPDASRSFEWLAFFLGLPGEVILASEGDFTSSRSAQPQLEDRAIEQNPLDAELYFLAQQRFERDYQQALCELAGWRASRSPVRRIFTVGEAWPLQGVYPWSLSRGSPVAWSGSQARFHLPIDLECRPGQRLYVGIEGLAEAPGVAPTLAMRWNGQPVESLAYKVVGHVSMWTAVTRPLTEIPGQGVHHLEVQSERRLCPPDPRPLAIALRRLTIATEAAG